MASILTDVSGVATTASSTPPPLKQKQRNSITVRKHLMEAERGKTSISDVYKNTLRSMINIFSNFSYINSEMEQVEVMCIFANPERAVAKYFEEQNIILPVLSIGQTTTEEDQKRGRNNSIIVQETVWDEKKQRWRRVVSLPAKPIRIAYTLNIFSKYRADLDQLLEQIRFAFNPSLSVPTDFSTLTKAFIMSEKDIGDDEISDKQDRVLKKSLEISVETYIPSPKFLLTSTGEIEKITAEPIVDHNEGSYD
jgi:hypothetical protein